MFHLYLDKKSNIYVKISCNIFFYFLCSPLLRVLQTGYSFVIITIIIILTFFTMIIVEFKAMKLLKLRSIFRPLDITLQNSMQLYFQIEAKPDSIKRNLAKKGISFSVCATNTASFSYFLKTFQIILNRKLLKYQSAFNLISGHQCRFRENVLQMVIFLPS